MPDAALGRPQLGLEQARVPRGLVRGLVRCAEPGQLIRLTSDDLQWLTDTEPPVRTLLAADLAERLRQR